MVSVGPEDNLNLFIKLDTHLKSLKNLSATEVWFHHLSGRGVTFTDKEYFVIPLGLLSQPCFEYAQICLYPKSQDPTISCLSYLGIRGLVGYRFK